jgi:hypothetical protein
MPNKIARAAVTLLAATATLLTIAGTADAAPTKKRVVAHTYKGATWNAEVGRSPAKVRSYLATMVKTQSLDFVALQEFRDYVPYLRQHPIKGYDLTGYRTNVTGGTQDPILVRAAIVHADGTAVDMGGDGWTTVDGKHHTNQKAGRVLINKSLRVYSIHAPVSVSWKYGRMSGPSERVDDYAAHSAHVVQLAKENSGASYVYAMKKHATGGSDHPFVTFKVQVLAGNKSYAGLFVGDWNAHKNDRGTYTPNWMMSKAKLTLAAPPLAGPGHHGIDFALYRKG